MKLPTRPSPITSYEDWKHQQAQQQQFRGPTIREPEAQQEEGNIRLASSSSTHESIEILSHSQLILDSRLNKMDKKLDKIKRFILYIMGCIILFFLNRCHIYYSKKIPRTSIYMVNFWRAY